MPTDKDGLLDVIRYLQVSLRQRRHLAVSEDPVFAKRTSVLQDSALFVMFEDEAFSPLVRLQFWVVIPRCRSTCKLKNHMKIKVFTAT
jgi:hypothetical protein